jgi:hypothetical protein
MPKPPDLEELENSANGNYPYDFAQAERVLKAMNTMRREAEKTHIAEIVTMIDATFRILVTTYCSILRYEMTKLPGSDDVVG